MDRIANPKLIDGLFEYLQLMIQKKKKLANRGSLRNRYMQVLYQGAMGLVISSDLWEMGRLESFQVCQ